MASTLVTIPSAVAKSFSPGHISGLLDIPRVDSNDSLQRGSRGAGFSLDKGITTSIEIYEDLVSGYQISINGNRARRSETEVSRWVIEEYLKLVNRNCYVSIEHEVSIPVGYGLGSSGAAALSLSYALNNGFCLGLNKEQAGQIAHRAEIACKTGLGTVIAEFFGGFELRTEAGAPGVGKVEKLDIDGYSAVVLCQAPISTKSFLANHIEKMNGYGARMLNKLVSSRDPNEFLEMSFEFAKKLGLINGQCKAPIEVLKSNGIGCGVALFGETVFTIVPTEQTESVKKLLNPFEGTLLVCDLDTVGARVL